MKFGESLRKERELRGMTLEEISQYTKVHIRFLEAIENDDLSTLPAKAFAKGFLRSYARMVGLDEGLVITNFEYCHHAMQTDRVDENVHHTVPEPSRHHPLLYAIVFAILLLLAIIISIYQGYLHIN
ncbi:hypothetical protein CSA56_01590 [candidate division KSB3 bacterium]|uniref:HTH cro/C1-type domain-containing protein n=1 Tax=candidate division KSB3 bacterium TaxID=2044937 RepID=A0A2G6KK88_9BACT|nr:MAG: hypothetical protein CSA56_01590 [candidate division KSB3 bacterium]